MTDHRADGGALRLSNSERDSAVARLNAHQRDGRLSESEFDTRAASVRAAVTRADLEPLFRDLPEDDAQGQAAPGSFVTDGSGGAAAPAASDYESVTKVYNELQPRRGPLGGTAGTVAVSLSPLVALVLFFLTGALFTWSFAWLWFILIPITGAIVYAAGTRGDGYRDRDRDRYRDRARYRDR